MKFLAPIASIFGLEVGDLVEHLKRNAVLFGLMALFLVITVVFLLVAAYVALSAAYGPLIASLTIAGVSLVLALIVYLISQVGEAERARIAKERRRKAEANAIMTTTALTALPALLRSPVARTLGLPIAAIAAFMFLRGRGSDDDA